MIALHCCFMRNLQYKIDFNRFLSFYKIKGFRKKRNHQNQISEQMKKSRKKQYIVIYAIRAQPPMLKDTSLIARINHWNNSFQNMYDML